MTWLFIVGVSLELAGAVLVAWTVFSRNHAETREEAYSPLDANLWVVLFREREQAYVRAGFALLGGGFALQLAGYVSELKGDGRFAAPFLAAAVFGISLFVSRRIAERRVPVKHSPVDELPAGLEDERHGFRLQRLQDVAWWRQAWVSRVNDRTITPLDIELRPRVNAGRWLFDCPICRASGNHAASLVTPGLPTGVCLTCGAEFRMAFPPERGEIERILMLRPKPNRNWDGETPEELRAENRAHGLPE